MYIGLTGEKCAGKGEVSNCFTRKLGFSYFSLSNELRAILSQEGKEITTERLIDIGNRIREEEGSGCLGKRVYDRIVEGDYQKVIIDGIRNPAEISELKKLGNFYVVSVEAPQGIRFDRMRQRKRENDPKTLEDFLELDAKDKGLGQPENGQQVGKCIKMADYTLINDGDSFELLDKVENLYSKIKGNIQ